MNFREFSKNYWLIGLCISLISSLYGTITYQLGVGIATTLISMSILDWLILGIPLIILSGLYIIISITILIINIFQTWKDNYNFKHKILDYIKETSENMVNYSTDDLIERIDETYKRVKEYYEVE